MCMRMPSRHALHTAGKLTSPFAGVHFAALIYLVGTKLALRNVHWQVAPSGGGTESSAKANVTSIGQLLSGCSSSNMNYGVSTQWRVPSHGHDSYECMHAYQT